MTIKEKMEQLRKKNGWGRWSKKDKSLYIKLTLRQSEIYDLEEYREEEFKEKETE